MYAACLCFTYRMKGFSVSGLSSPCSAARASAPIAILHRLTKMIERFDTQQSLIGTATRTTLDVSVVVWILEAFWGELLGFRLRKEYGGTWADRVEGHKPITCNQTPPCLEFPVSLLPSLSVVVSRSASQRGRTVRRNQAACCAYYRIFLSY